MRISTVSLKGGSGKTTVAINLAVYFSSLGQRVTIVDADENENSLKWSGIRESEINPVLVVGLKTPAALRNNINQVYDSCDIVIIDGTPAINEMATTILLCSDIAIFPLQASPLDVWAFNDKFIPRFNEVRMLRPDLMGLILLNNIDPRTRFSKEVKEFADDCEVPVLNSVLSDLQVYKDSISYGLGVIETKHAKARHEVMVLSNELNEHINIISHDAIEENNG